MMKFLQIFAVTVFSTFAGLAMAGELTIPNTFVSSQTARASEVNDNFNAVKTEVDDNSARIDINASGMSFKQERVSGSCPAGQFMRVINPDGSVGCLAINSAVTQNRVSGTCVPGESIRTVNEDGSVICQADTNTTYTAGDGLTLTDTVFTTDPSVTQRRLTEYCAVGSSISVINQDGTVTCQTYTAGPGIQQVESENNGTEFREFRPADGYVSVPYSAFVATNVSRVDTEISTAYPANFPEIFVYGSLHPIEFANNGFPTLVTSEHPQLQVCQLSHQLSPDHGYTYFVNNGNADCDAIAPLNLPHGAVLDSVSCKVSENSTNSLRVKLYRVPLFGDQSTQEAIFAADDDSYDSINQDPPQIITAPLTGDGVSLIENNNYAYHLQMIWVTDALGPAYKVYGCSVGYTY